MGNEYGSKRRGGAHTRVSEQALEFNRQFIQDMLGTGSDNRQHLKLAQKALHEVIAQELTERQRELLLLYYFEQRTMVEIGETLGINKSTVSRTMARAKKRIYAHMRFYFDYRSFQLTED